MRPDDINYPKPPEGGWKKWFLEHPHQRMVLPVMHRGFTMFYDEGDKIPQPTLDTFEIQYVSNGGYLHARCGNWNGTWRVMGTDASFVWNRAVEQMFSAAMQPQEQPAPSGTGWDDFDWSK